MSLPPLYLLSDSESNIHHIPELSPWQRIKYTSNGKLDAVNKIKEFDMMHFKRPGSKGTMCSLIKIFFLLLNKQIFLYKIKIWWNCIIYLRWKSDHFNFIDVLLLSQTMV